MSEQYLSEQSALDPVTGRVIVPRSAGEPVAFDPTVIDELVGAFGDRGADVRRDLLSSYVGEGDPRMAELLEAVREGERDAVRRVAHTLRSSSRLLGLLELADVLDELEVAAGPGSDEPLDGRVARAAALYRQGAGGIRALLATGA